LKLSIIIPTYNEEAGIGELLRYLQQHGNAAEVVVADGQSTDATRSVAISMGVQVIVSNRRGRAAQMNEGAAMATGDILYFLHADTFPPPNFLHLIDNAVKQGYGSGCFRLAFNVPHWFLKANAWFTRFDVDAIRFGDQSLFVQREIFEKSGGFDERMLLLEDQEIIGRLRRFGKFKIVPEAVRTSARKYETYGIYKLQGGYYLIYALYKLGASQQQLMRVYKWLLR
jgi:rSAM/selenodomain-associated transferase 2